MGVGKRDTTTGLIEEECLKGPISVKWIVVTTRGKIFYVPDKSHDPLEFGYMETLL